MMVFMMRGMHGGHGMHGGGQQDPDDSGQKQASLQELRRRQEELSAQIEALEEQSRYGSTTPSEQVDSLNEDRMATRR